MKKRVISMILAFCMLVSVAPAGAAAGTYQRPYQQTVNNQVLSNEICYLDTTNIDNMAVNKIPTDADDHYAYFKDGVLTLKNVDLKYSLTVRSQKELTINLIGDNYINFQEQGTALRLEELSKLTINGPGSLTIKSADKIENSKGSTVSLDRSSNLIINTTVNVYGANATAEGFSGNDAVSGSDAVFTIGKGATLNAWGGNGDIQAGKALFLHQATFNVQKDAYVNLTVGVDSTNDSIWAVYLSGNEPHISSYGHIVIDNSKGSSSEEAILSDNDTAKINIFRGSFEVISKANAMKTNLISVKDNVVEYEVIAGADKQAATKVETPDASTYTSNSYFKLTVNQAHDKYNITYKHTPNHWGEKTHNISTIGNVPTRVPNDSDIFPYANSYECLKYWEIGNKGSGNKVYPHKEYTFTGDTVLYGYYGTHTQFDLVQGKAPTNLEEGWKDYYRCKDCGKLFENIDRATEGYGYISNLEAWKTGAGKLERLPGGAQYTVKHLKENINAVGTYELAETQVFYTLPDSLTEAKANTYENYTAQPIDQVPVNADGSTVVEIKYDCVKYNLTWNFEGGTPTNDYTSGKVPVGADIVIPKPRKTGSQFLSWRSPTGEAAVLTKMPKRDLTYTAGWKFYTNEQKGKPATCTEAGYKTYYEAESGKFYEDEFARTFIGNIYEWKGEGGNGYIPPTGHAFGKWQYDDTDHWKNCSVCGTVAEQAAHTFDEWSIVTPATETADGLRKHTCSVCGHEATEVIPAEGHTHAGTLVTGQAATCTADGWKDYYKCSCGKFFEDVACTTEISDLDAWKNGDGKLAKLEHTLGEWQHDDANHWKKCSVCGTIAEQAAHTFGEWTIVTPATETADGLKAYLLCLRSRSNTSDSCYRSYSRRYFGSRSGSYPQC